MAHSPPAPAGAFPGSGSQAPPFPPAPPKTKPRSADCEWTSIHTGVVTHSYFTTVSCTAMPHVAHMAAAAAVAVVLCICVLCMVRAGGQGGEGSPPKRARASRGCDRPRAASTRRSAVERALRCV